MSVLVLPRLRLPSTLLLGATLLALIVTAAIVGIWVTPYDPTVFAVRFRLQAPSLLHPFGTDEFGRDVLSRILAGAHLSLATGFGAMAISLVVGVGNAFRSGPSEISEADISREMGKLAAG